MNCMREGRCIFLNRVVSKLGEQEIRKKLGSNAEFFYSKL